MVTLAKVGRATVRVRAPGSPRSMLFGCVVYTADGEVACAKCGRALPAGERFTRKLLARSGLYPVCGDCWPFDGYEPYRAAMDQMEG
jgi:hypothetical protein